MIIKQAFVHYRTALLRCGRTVLMSIFFQNLNYEIPIVEEIQNMPLNQKVFTQGKGWILFVFDHKPLVSWFPCVQYSMTLKQKIASFRKKTVERAYKNSERRFSFMDLMKRKTLQKHADTCGSQLSFKKQDTEDNTILRVFFVSFANAPIF